MKETSTTSNAVSMTVAYDVAPSPVRAALEQLVAKLDAALAARGYRQSFEAWFCDGDDVFIPESAQRKAGECPICGCPIVKQLYCGFAIEKEMAAAKQALAQPPSPDAVDPVPGIVAEVRRATKDSSDLSPSAAARVHALIMPSRNSEAG